MPKQIILYNLKDGVSDEDYRQFCREYKGPFIAGLPGCASFSLVKMPGAMKGSGLERKPPEPGAAPFRYLGIVDIADPAAWEKARSSREYLEEFLPRWMSKVADFYILPGEDVWPAG